MTKSRRPVRGRARGERRVCKGLNFSQIRREVIILSEVGMILREEDFLSSVSSVFASSASRSVRQIREQHTSPIG